MHDEIENFDSFSNKQLMENRLWKLKLKPTFDYTAVATIPNQFLLKK